MNPSITPVSLPVCPTLLFTRVVIRTTGIPLVKQLHSRLRPLHPTPAPAPLSVLWYTCHGPPSPSSQPFYLFVCLPIRSHVRGLCIPEQLLPFLFRQLRGC